MVEIVDVQPPRFRPGQQIEILGLAFSPSFGDNAVTVDTQQAPVLEESDTRLLVEVPAGVSQDQFVAVQVQRSDTGDNDSASYWCKAPREDLLDGTNRIPGQAPGALEARDPAQVRDTPQAQDFDAYATLLEWLIYEVATAKGDLLASDGVTPPLAFAVGAAGQALQAAPAAALGVAWGAAPAPGRVSLDWSKQVDAPGAANGPMVANGQPTDQSTTKGEHVALQAGTVDSLAVLVQSAGGGDTLDRVQVNLNGVLAYDSGAGLGIGAGAAHQANPAVAVVAGDRLELVALKAGSGAIMQLRGKLGLA